MDYILDNNNERIWEGYCIDMLEKLSEKMEFNYEIVIPTNNKYDEGLTEDLVNGNTDIIIAPLKMTAQREEVLDFGDCYKVLLC